MSWVKSSRSVGFRRQKSPTVGSILNDEGGKKGSNLIQKKKSAGQEKGVL